MSVRAHNAILLPVLLLVACGESELQSYDLSGHAMGTTFNITLIAPPADADLNALRIRISEKLEHIENIASTYRNSSELSTFNLNPSTDWISVSQEFCEMVSAAQELSATTYGAFDITVGPLVNLWGFGPSNRENELPTSDEVSAAHEYVGYEFVQADCDQSVLRKTAKLVYLDFSGWAKGYAVDEVAALLEREKLENYLVEIGGEISVRGHNAKQHKFSIALEKPISDNDIQYSVWEFSDVAVATSGDYRNFFDEDGQRYSHTIDPRTGYPTRHHLTGVTVVSSSTAYADAMATAFMVLGPDDGYALAEKLGIAGYFLVRTDNGIEEKLTSQFEKLRRP